MQKQMGFTDDPMYEAARKGLDSIMDRIKTGFSLNHEGMWKPSLKKHVWKVMKEGDPRSPKIMQLDDGDEDIKRFIIYYPKNSTPYPEKLVDKFKLARILDGEIWDQVEDKVYKKDDLVCVKPGDMFLPKTKDKECHVLVEISSEMVKQNPNFIYRNCGDVK